MRLVDTSGLPVGEGACLFTPITAHLDDVPWRPAPITYEEAPQLARLLSTACFITIAYLSGMRPGEVLNLRRGCAYHDAATGLFLLHGRHFKGVPRPHRRTPAAR